MRFFITGIGGFAGAHLADHLLAAGHDVDGLVSRASGHPRLQALSGRYPRFDPARLACADITDGSALAWALAQFAPQGVFHLAGITFVPRAGADVARTMAVNALGTLRLLEAVQESAPAARVLVVSSAEAYGAVPPDALPVTEEVPLRPISVYGLSKAAADMAAFQQWWQTGLAVIRVRAFNHTGPGQGPEFACSDFARQLARIERDQTPPELHVGSLAAVRDFSDVRDIVRGYALLLERGVPGEAYNLCSGTGTSLAVIVEHLRAMCRVRVGVVEDRGRLRGREVPTLVGTAARAEALGWSPAIPIQQTLGDLLEHWRYEVA